MILLARVKDGGGRLAARADFARARPFPEMFPELARKLKAQGGRPRLERPKVHVGIRLAADVVEGIKATGKGYNARVERVPREALEQGTR